MKAFSENRTEEKYSDKMIELLVMEFFVLLLRKYEQEAEFSIPYINNSDEKFRALFQYMQTHFRTITLPKLAMQFNYSERQIIRILEKHTEKNFSELLLEIRMNKAIQLIKNPAIPMSEIASLLGYSSNSYFVKVFVKTFSFHPNDFRNKIEKIKTESIYSDN